MAYSGSTALSSIANPPVCVFQPNRSGVNTLSTGGNSIGLWIYNSSNGSTELQAANYFTDAYAIGMRTGDLLMGVSCTGSSVNIYMGVMAVVTSSGGNIASTGGNLSSNR